jgi:hypothetical protein
MHQDQSTHLNYLNYHDNTCTTTSNPHVQCHQLAERCCETQSRVTTDMALNFSWNSISKRWQLIILLHTGFIIEYCLRVNASVAVVEMKKQYDWDDNQRGLMLSSFYW